MAPANTLGAVAEHLQVVGVGSDARSHIFCQRDTNAVQLLQAPNKWHQCSDEQEGAEWTSLVYTHLLSHWVRGTINHIGNHERRASVNVLATRDKVVLNA